MLGQLQMEVENFNADFSKFSLIRNKFGAHWIQIRGPIYELFENLSIKTYVLGA